jgi:tyrosinase
MAIGASSKMFLFLCGVLHLTIMEASAYAPCTPANTRVRKEWGSLTKLERTQYINAVHCMQTLPSKLDPAVVPGAKHRQDDFVATHINKTLSIHLDGIFLSWHRNFVWLWETALIEECGYQGAQPYWNWALWCDDLAASPLFDGSATSLSGDGVYEPDQGPYIVGGGATLPHGTGGGCVTSGPFVNQTTNLGPFAFDLVFSGLPSNWTAYSPHCLSRDLNNYIASRYGNQTAIDILMNTTTIASFQDTMSGVDINLGVHGGGHFSIGLGLQDFFASPADPAFFLHHGMIDRVWALWQGIGEGRVWELSGTSTIFNGNSTPPVTLETLQDWGVLAEGTRETWSLLQVGEEGFCYRYA